MNIILRKKGHTVPVWDKLRAADQQHSNSRCDVLACGTSSSARPLGSCSSASNYEDKNRNERTAGQRKTRNSY